MYIYIVFILTTFAVPIHIFSASGSSFESALSCSSSSGDQTSSTASVFHEVLLSMQANNSFDSLSLCTEIAHSDEYAPKHQALALALMGCIHAAPEGPVHNLPVARIFYERALEIDSGLTGEVRRLVLEYQKKIEPKLHLTPSPASQAIEASSSSSNHLSRDKPGLPKKFRAYLRHKHEAEKRLRAADQAFHSAPNFKALLDVVEQERKALRNEEKFLSQPFKKKARRK